MIDMGGNKLYRILTRWFFGGGQSGRDISSGYKLDGSIQQHGGSKNAGCQCMTIWSWKMRFETIRWARQRGPIVSDNEAIWCLGPSGRTRENLRCRSWSHQHAKPWIQSLQVRQVLVLEVLQIRQVHQSKRFGWSRFKLSSIKILA